MEVRIIGRYNVQHQKRREKAWAGGPQTGIQKLAQSSSTVTPDNTEKSEAKKKKHETVSYPYHSGLVKTLFDSWQGMVFIDQINAELIFLEISFLNLDRAHAKFLQFWRRDPKGPSQKLIYFEFYDDFIKEYFIHFGNILMLEGNVNRIYVKSQENEWAHHVYIGWKFNVH